jgi:hypothetical protein
MSIQSPRLSPTELQKNFADIAPALTPNEAVIEASRCLFCFDAPRLPDAHRRAEIHPANHGTRSQRLGENHFFIKHFWRRVRSRLSDGSSLRRRVRAEWFE